MVGIIRRREQIKLPESFDPSSIFDANDTCTEEDFIRLLEAGIYDSSLIGKYVTLSNSVGYNGGKWVIADVDHDSENTGQTNCYDLISVDCFSNQVFGATMNTLWRNSSLRTQLNNSFYLGFSTDLKSHIVNIKYKIFNGSTGDWYTDDKIIVPSWVEVGFIIDNASSFYIEGVRYPIFTLSTGNSNDRIKKYNNTAQAWWLRSMSPDGGVLYVKTNGGINTANAMSQHCVAPLFRVS